MREISTEELVSIVLKRFVYLHSRTRIALLRRIRKECPFYIDGKCENPLNPKTECTYDPGECPYINMITVSSIPIPAFLVPLRVMEKEGYIKILIGDKEIEIVPGERGGATHARRAALLLFRALQVYGNPDERKIRNLERLS